MRIGIIRVDELMSCHLPQITFIMLQPMVRNHTGMITWNAATKNAPVLHPVLISHTNITMGNANVDVVFVGFALHISNHSVYPVLCLSLPQERIRKRLVRQYHYSECLIQNIPKMLIKFSFQSLSFFLGEIVVWSQMVFRVSTICWARSMWMLCGMTTSSFCIDNIFSVFLCNYFVTCTIS